jgi:general secretion pathway protein D
VRATRLRACVIVLFFFGTCWHAEIGARAQQPPARINTNGAALKAIPSAPSNLPSGVASVISDRLPARLPDRLDVVEFREIPLADAMRILSEQSGLSLAASPDARKISVSLYLKNVTADGAIDALCKANNLWSRTDPKSNVTFLYTTEEYQRDLTSFREEKTEVFTLLYPNPVDVASAIRNLYGTRVVLNLDPRWDDMYEDLEQRLDRFDLIDGRSQGLGFFEGRGGLAGIGGFGGGADFGRMGWGRSRSGLLRDGGPVRRQDVVRDARAARQEEDKTREIPLRERFEDLTPEEIGAIEAEQRGQTTSDQKALVEALLVRRQATIYVTVIRQHNQLIIRTSDEQTMQQIRDLISRLDVPTPLVLLEVKILQVDLGSDFNSVFDYQFSDGGTIAGGFTSGNILPPASDNPNAIAAGLTRRDTSVSPGGTGLNEDHLYFQFVNDSFRLRLQLFENNNRVTTLATPLLLTANNEVSRLFVGQEVPLNRSFTGPTPLAAGAGITVPFTAGSTGIEFRPVGTTLFLTPNINADRTVTLRVLQEISRVQEDGANVLVPTDTGFADQPVDIVQSRTVSGTVVGMDGLTVAIGGLIEEAVGDDRGEVPLLGKLPVVGFFFRRQHTVRSRNELLILIRPYVFNTPAEAAAQSDTLLQELSIHPMNCCPTGTMGTFAPHEPLRANPPVNPCQKLFRFHSLELKK